MAKEVKAASLPDVVKVRATQIGYARPMGEPRVRLIEAGEEFFYEGKLGKWMEPADKPAAPPAPVYIPDAIKRAMGRAREVQDSRAAEVQREQERLAARQAKREKSAQETEAEEAAALAEKRAREQREQQAKG